MRPTERGFTLIELLITIVILALTTLMLVEGVRMVARHVGGREAGLDRASTIIAVEGFLRAELADARPFPTKATLSFEGRSNGVAFVSVAPASVAAGGLMNLSLEIVQVAKAGAALRLNWRPYQGAAVVSESSGSGRLLLDNLRDVRFAYFGAAQSNGRPQWQDTWIGMTSLPMLIRLRMTLANGEVLPDLVVALRLYPGPGDMRNARRRF
ncbi:MAG: ral secretion pathway protein [Rhodospirillales bacterium]|jgi:prepilin-type N-terminal cleavage/methylation domain-containing protein|nr:ral secretion pathway protein [Rhodospirillales bacterium]